METATSFFGIHDLISLMLLVIIVCLGVSKYHYPYHFRSFISLIGSDRYLKTHLDSTSKKRLQLLLTGVYLIAAPLVIFLGYIALHPSAETPILDYLKICAGFYSYFAISLLWNNFAKMIFGFDRLIGKFSFQKQSYFNYLILFFLTILVFIHYLKINEYYWLEKVGYFGLICLGLIGILLLKNQRTRIFQSPYYFILYLCAFEISMYFLGYYLISKSLQI